MSILHRIFGLTPRPRVIRDFNCSSSRPAGTATPVEVVSPEDDITVATCHGSTALAPFVDNLIESWRLRGWSLEHSVTRGPVVTAWTIRGPRMVLDRIQEEINTSRFAE